VVAVVDSQGKGGEGDMGGWSGRGGRGWEWRGRGRGEMGSEGARRDVEEGNYRKQ